jgi:hypothetical protein
MDCVPCIYLFIFTEGGSLELIDSVVVLSFLRIKCGAFIVIKHTSSRYVERVNDFIIRGFGSVEDFRKQAYSARIYWISYCVA